MRILFALACLLIAAAAFGQKSVFVQFETEGDRHAWIHTGLPSGPPEDGVKTKKTVIEMDVEGRAPTDTVFVWDLKTGNLVSRTLRDFKPGESWKVKDTDAWDIAQVEVNVLSNGKPVAAANVLLNDGRRTRRQLVDAGVAKFFAVKPGALKVTVEYRSEGSGAAPVTQILDAKLKRDDVVPSITIALPEPTATVAAPASSAASGEAAPATDPAPAAPKPASRIGSILGYLFGLGIAVAVGVGLYLYTRRNPQVVEDKLKELGVQIPEPGDSGAEPDPVPVATPMPEPPQKIVLENADPTPLSASPAPVVDAGVPALVADNGDVLELGDEVLTVGREVGLGLSLVSESTVSRRHAELSVEDGVATVRDLGSTNGTYVNGAKVEEAQLRSGDVVQFGSVRFRYRG